MRDQHPPAATDNDKSDTIAPVADHTQVRRDPILGGLFNEYRHAA